MYAPRKLGRHARACIIFSSRVGGEEPFHTGATTRRPGWEEKTILKLLTALKMLQLLGLLDCVKLLIFSSCIVKLMKVF